MEKKESLEQVPAIRAGDKVLRRRRKPRGIFHNIFRRVLRLFKGTASR